MCHWSAGQRTDLLCVQSPRSLSLHLFNNPEHRWTNERVVCNAHCSEYEPLLVRVRVFSAHVWPNVVDRAAVIIAEKRARLLSSLVGTILIVRFQIRLNELIHRHVELTGDPLDIVIVESDVHRLAAVGAASAIDDLESLLMQLACQLIGIKSVVSEFHAAEELVALFIISLGVLSPVVYNGIVIHVNLLPPSPVASQQ
jgi:hypothetical protein